MTKNHTNFIKFSVVLLSVTFNCVAAPIYFVATDQTGAQTQIDVNHTSTWLMTPDIDFEFGGGLFTMKDGNNTSEPVTFSLYQGTNSSGLLLGSVSLTHTAFCAQVSNCGQFQFHRFLFEAPVSLVTGTTYFAALTSVANDVQSEAYFIKSSFFVSDQNGARIEPQPAVFGEPSASPVPEPGSLEMLVIGLVIIIFRSELAKLGSLQLPMVRRFRRG